jgi:hypothetical protein
MNKRYLHHIFVKLRPISYWYFAVLFVISGSVAIYALRQNNLTALRLRDKVLQVDQQNGNVEAALQELREFTYSHMNANLASDTGIYPPVQLKYTYDRLVAAEQAKVESENKDVYGDAQAHCESTSPQGFSGSNRIACIQQYVDQHAGPAAEPRPIPDALYKFDFVAPSWSPDVAGWALLVAMVAFLLLITRLAAQWWLRSQLD